MYKQFKQRHKIIQKYSYFISNFGKKINKYKTLKTKGKQIKLTAPPLGAGGLPFMLQSAYTKDLIEVGVDEVGRGCLAGNVVASAVILPKDFTHDVLKDSKKIPKNLHQSLAQEIKDNALAWAIAEASPAEIDKYNILQATYLAMHRALDMLDIRPELILVDGNRFKPYDFTPHNCIVKGDNKFFAIAAASILAKAYRDAQMETLALEFPAYDWDKNVGYPTKNHKKAIAIHGFTQWHRLTFKST